MRRTWVHLSPGLLIFLAFVAPCAAQEISEFMASNDATFLDGNGNSSDWIEIGNPGAAAVDLSGWYLTDASGNLEKWAFPEGVVLEPGVHLVVFASSQDEEGHVDPDGFFHTNFALSAGGEYLALVMPDGVTVVSEYPRYPAQSTDISYGLLDGAEQFFSIPTPGAPNQANPAASPEFSRAGGIIIEPFNLELTAAVADVRFTLDGTFPDEGSDLYTTPLAIEATTHVRARAFTAAGDSSLVVSHSYLLLAEDVREFSSNLPLVVIDSLGFDINATAGREGNRSRAPRAPVYSVFLDTGDDGRTRLTGAFDFAGRAGMKIRGNSSQVAPKKQYSLEVWDEANDDRSVPILGLPAESDWVFHAPYGDKTLMRNHLAYKWWGELGYYSVRTRFCELFYNFDDGVVSMDDYAGVYVFMEKIKRDESRVDLTKLTPNDNSEPEISGGYIVKVDIPDPGETIFTTPRGPDFGSFVIAEPKPEDLTQEQRDWISNYFNDFEEALFGADAEDPVLGYANWIDVQSFVDYFLFTEMVKNGDGFYLSIFYNKERGEKLAMGPVWDFNVCLGNDLDWDAWNPENFLSAASGSFWYGRLFRDPAAVDLRQRRWQEWRREFFLTDQLLADIDETAALLDEAQQRNFERWDILGKRVEPEQVNPPGFSERDTYEKEVQWMREWLIGRLAWLDDHFREPPGFSVENPRITAPTEVSILNPNAEGEILYTLNGPDPRLDDGQMAPEARVFDEPIVITENTRIRARVLFNDDSWSELSEVGYFTELATLVLSEMMYAPIGGRDFEFLEVFNFGDDALNLNGVRFTEGIDFDFPDETLQPGEYVVIVGDREAFDSRYATEGVRILGAFEGVLQNGGEAIRLEGSTGEPLADFQYDDAWHPETDGGGHSLVLVDPRSPPESWSAAIGWRPSLLANGSPGKEDSVEQLSGSQIPADCNQDGRTDLSDGVCLLGNLFLGDPLSLPCGDGSTEENLALLDSNGDGRLDISDGSHILGFLFLGGAPPVLGVDCAPVLGCPEGAVGCGR